MMKTAILITCLNSKAGKVRKDIFYYLFPSAAWQPATPAFQLVWQLQDQSTTEPTAPIAKAPKYQRSKIPKHQRHHFGTHIVENW